MSLPKRELGSLPEFDYVLGDRAVIETFKVGARVHFSTKFGKSIDPPAPRPPRIIRDQSTPSRSRAAFTFGNAECDWLAMTTLTWHHAPDSAGVKTALDKLRRAWAVRWCEPMDGWIMEMQSRGVPHFHVFHALQSSAGQIIAAMPTRLVRRKGRPTELVGGSFENWLVQTWLACTGEREDFAASDTKRICLSNIRPALGGGGGSTKDGPLLLGLDFLRGWKIGHGRFPWREFGMREICPMSSHRFPRRILHRLAASTF